MKRKIGLAVWGLLIGFLGYCGFIVYQARANTEQVVRTYESHIMNPLNLGTVPVKRMELLLRVQDQNFYSHGGTDFLSGKITTITQSLTKQLYFEHFKPGFAKIKQSLIACFALDSLISKDRQLNLFLNLVYLGSVNGVEIHGFSQASQAYFGKAFSVLSEEEYLKLLAMLDGPNEYNLKLNPERNLARVEKLRSQFHIN